MPRLEGPVPQVQAKEGPMPQLPHKRRPRWATLAVVALIATLLATAGPAGPAAAATGTPDHTTSLTACVGDATQDKMFPDVSEGHYFRDAINCLAYYGVTIGYEDGTFKPNDNVARAEMVLFMQRAAAKAGVSDASTVVGDFATTGSDPVNRADMALLIARLLDAATAAVGTAKDGTFTVGGSAPDDFFTDARASLDRVRDSAASVLYETGVAMGTGGNMFSPTATVTRGAMAAFITRALAHTTARPAGVTMQELDTGGAKISVRSADFQPVADARLDLISIDTAKIAEAFNSDGTCNTKALADEGGSRAKCEIDFLDPSTEDNGDYDQAITVATGGTTLWAWTGAVGDKITKDSEGVAMIELTKSTAVPGTQVKISTSLPTVPTVPVNVTKAKLGSTVTVTIQLVDTTGMKNAVPTAAQMALKHPVTTRVCHVTNDGATENETASSPCLAASDDLDINASGTETVQLDSTGKAEFTVSIPDPDPDDTGDTNPDNGTVSYTITLGSEGTTALTLATGSSLTSNIAFTDESPAVTTVSVKNAGANYDTVPTTGVKGNTVVVTVLDQYGNGMPGQNVALTSTSTGTTGSKMPPSDRDKTGTNGTIRISYDHGTAAAAETIGVSLPIWEKGPDGETGGGDDRTLVTTGCDSLTSSQACLKDTMFYWAGSANGTGALEAVVAGSLDKNEIVVNADSPVLVRYDANDQFTVTDTNEAAATDESGYGMAKFEEWLAKDMDITPTSTDTNVNGQQLSWGGYVASDSSEVTNLTLSGSAT